MVGGRLDCRQKLDVVAGARQRCRSGGSACVLSRSKRWRRIAGQCLQVCTHLRNNTGVNGLTTLMPGQHGLEHVASFKEGIDHVVAQHQLLLANAVEQIFQYMGNFGEIGKTKGAARPLDRVRCPEDGVQLFTVGGVQIQPEQQ